MSLCVALAVACGAHAAEAPASAREVSAAEWDPGLAAEVQARAERAALGRATGASDDRTHAALRAAEASWRARAFGEGVPHESDDESPARRRARAEAAERARARDHAEAWAARTGVGIAEALGRFESAAVAGSVGLTLRTVADGPVHTGGYVQAYASDGSYLGFSNIQAGGAVTLNATPGQQVDLYVVPNAPFALQRVSNVVVQPAAVVTLAAGRRVPVRFVPPTGAYAGAATVRLSIDRGAATASVLPDTTYGSVPSIYLAAGASYDARASVEAPYLAAPLTAVPGTAAELEFTLETGFVLKGVLSDPDDLLSGCFVSGQVTASRPRPATGLADEMLAQGTIEYASGRPTGFTLAVPRRAPVTAELSFFGSGACTFETWSLENVRFTEDAAVTIPLKPRPRPVVTVRDDAGTVVPYTHGYFVPVDTPDVLHYFTPSFSSTALRAGREYRVFVEGPVDLGRLFVRFTAIGGEFAVDIAAQRLASVAVALKPPSGIAMGGLLKVRRGGEVVTALELRGSRDYALRVPPGDYVLELTGLAGEGRIGNDTVAYLLRPRTESRTVSSAAGQRIELAIPAPANGVRFDLSAAELPLHFTALENGEPTSAYALFPYFDGVMTDYTELRLRVRGPGLDDVAIDAAPSPLRPVIDVLGRATAVPRFSGTLRSSAGAPLPNQPILFYGEHATTSATKSTDAQGRFDLPKVRNSLYYFQAPEAGLDVPRSVSFASPGATQVQDVVLEAAAISTPVREGPALQRIHGTGDRDYRIVFVTEGYTTLSESFTDVNGNGVWDGVLFLDYNADGLWQSDEPVRAYGARTHPGGQQGTNVAAANEPFVDQNADGYPNIDDYAVFAQNAQSYLRSLLAMPEVRNGLSFDAYVLFLPSAQAGIDVRTAAGETILTRDTRFGAVLDRTRGILTVDGAAVVRSIGEAIDRWNVQVVLIQQPVPVGRVTSFILATGGVGNSSPNNLVSAHEFGHNPGGLQDEYDEFGGTYVQFATSGHLTHEPDASRSPWRAMTPPRLDAPIAVPNSTGLGLYAGALYQAGGIYRPSSNSRMRGNVPLFNAPSQRLFTRAVCFASLSYADLVLPAPPAPAAPVLFASGMEAAYAPVSTPCGT